MGPWEGVGATRAPASRCKCWGLTPSKKVYVVEVDVNVHVNVNVDVNVDVDVDVDDVDVDGDAHTPYTHNVPTAWWRILERSGRTNILKYSVFDGF